MTRALITGAAGFIGGSLVRRLLAEGWEVHALLGRTCRRETLKDVEHQVTVHNHDGSMDSMLTILQKTRPDVVFHLASLFLADHRPEDVGALIQSNLLLSTQLAEAMTACGISRLVNTGTSWQHYHQAGYRPVNLYAATKQAFEDILAYYHDARSLSCITLELYDNYGPDDPRRKLVQILFDAARSGELLDMSPGEQVLDLLHVDDVVLAFEVAAERLRTVQTPVQESFHVSGERVTVRDLAVIIARVTGREIRVVWGRRPYRPREVMVPVSAGPSLPGWAPALKLESGLRACWEALEARRAGA